jgi:phage/plasmid primase-like uncharacterized protein
MSDIARYCPSSRECGNLSTLRKGRTAGRRGGRKASYDFIREVREAARDRWPEILPACGMEPRYLAGEPGPCPHCGGMDGFRFDPDSARGQFTCTRADGTVPKGDGFDLLWHAQGWSFGHALRVIAPMVGIEEPRRMVAVRTRRPRARSIVGPEPNATASASTLAT